MCLITDGLCSSSFSTSDLEILGYFFFKTQTLYLPCWSALKGTKKTFEAQMVYSKYSLIEVRILVLMKWIIQLSEIYYRTPQKTKLSTEWVLLRCGLWSHIMSACYYLFRFLFGLVFVQKLSFGVGDLTASKHTEKKIQTNIRPVGHLQQTLVIKHEYFSCWDGTCAKGSLCGR